MALFDDASDLVLGVGEIDFIAEGDPPQAEDAMRHKKTCRDKEPVQVSVQADDPCVRSEDGQRIDQCMRPGEKDRPHPVHQKKPHDKERDEEVHAPCPFGPERPAQK